MLSATAISLKWEASQPFQKSRTVRGLFRDRLRWGENGVAQPGRRAYSNTDSSGAFRAER